jgi:hypothetical protein
MVRPCTLSLALVLAASLAAQSTEKISIRFETASYALGPAELVTLQALCGRPDAHRITGITLSGHTDPRGSEAYNRVLSAHRVDAVQRALQGTCLKDLPIDVQGAVESEALEARPGQDDYATKRRVDVQLAFAPECATPSAIVFSHVVPLLPLIDKRCEVVTVDATAAIDRTMSDGVRVRIPAGAIVDANGQPVNSPVLLSYRGFQEPYEIIASGIPMHVATPDGIKHMESAGMYELTASLNGQPLALAIGSSITLDPPTPIATDEGYIAWALDESTGEWRPSGELLAAPLSSVPATNTTAATQAYWSEIFRLERETAPDSTLFDQRRRSAHYCHMRACDTTATSTSWVKRRNRFRDEGGVPEISVVAYKGIYDPDHMVFSIRMPSWSERQFPEWRRIPSNALFAYTGPHSRAVFKRLYGRRHFFQDIVLDMADGNTDGTLWLKENGEWLELPVSVRYDRSQPLREARWKKAMTLYDKALARREATFDREVKKKVARYKRQHANMPLAAWKEARDEMNTDEKSFDLQAWMPYAQERPYQMPMMPGASPWSAFGKVRTSISVYGFGKVNVDRYLEMPEQLNVIASTADSAGRPFPWVRAYAVPDGRNAVITYQGNGEGRADALLVAPGLMKSFFLVDADGNVMRADARPLNSRKPKVVLQVVPVGNPKTIDELRAQASL